MHPAPDPDGDVVVGQSTVRFDLGAPPMDVGDVPVPTVLYDDANGRFQLDDFPNADPHAPVFAALRDLLVKRGACTTCAAYAYVDGGLDPASAVQPGAEPTVGDPIALVDTDPRSSERGRAFPLEVQYDEATGLLTVRPRGGYALKRRHDYALVLTDGLIGTDGLPLHRADVFDALIQNQGHPDYQQALDVLADAGVDWRHVVGLGPFTTGDPLADVRSVRDALDDAAVPAVVAVDRVWAGDALDELLGVPVDGRPGADAVPLGEGERAIRHETTAFAVAGRFRAPRFVAGSGSEVGGVVRDDLGRPVVQSTEEVPFLLIVPDGADLAHLPVVVAHHGFNASRTTGFVLADTAGRAGAAVLSFDAYQHGDRAASASDQRNALRGVDGPDGFAETSELDVSGRVFGVIGVPQGQAFAADLPLSAFLQFEADALSAIRLVREGELGPIRAADPGLAALAFDPERVAFVGNSLGAVVGSAVTAVSPDLAAVVLDVAPGSIVDTLTDSATFRPLSESLLLPSIGVAGPFDEVGRAMHLDPAVDLYRWALEPVDPLVLAPVLWADRMDERVPPSLLVQLAGHDEVAAPGPSEAFVRATGLPGVGTFALAEVPEASLPTDGVAWRFDGATHGMLEQQRAEIAWAAPLVPPLEALGAPEGVENPIDEVHAQIEGFLRTAFEEGRGVVR
ncbi:MAG: hypothetical protein R3F59_12350 [Myxococcota bacterium]